MLSPPAADNCDPTSPKTSKKSIWICLLLLASISAVYWPVAWAQFIPCDDPDYVYENLHVTEGLSWAGVQWAFTTGYANNWHPLTWLSHMLDWQLYGGKAGFHHLTSVVFHAANTLLLFTFLRRATGAVWRAAFVAALFALHPLHVESVAWVSERKDVLSTFFFMLTLLAYAAYAKSNQSSVISDQSSGKRPNSQPSTFNSQPFRYYVLTLLCFACGLMSKPMLVTVPFVLLLLDYWPLGRWPISNTQPSTAKPQQLRRLVLEKIPFFAFSVLSSVITVIVQRQQGNMPSIEALPLGLRLSNAVLSCFRYLCKMLWPAELSAFYPYSNIMPTRLIAVAVVLIAGFSLLALCQFRRRPWLIVGWFWFLGTLLPVIGIVQVGSQSMADRYTYTPLIGVFVVLVWAVTETTANWKFRTPAMALAGLGVLGYCCALTFRQARLWQDGETLFRHALSVTSGNDHAHVNLGVALMTKNEIKEASEHFAEALRINPGYIEAEGDLALTLAMQGRLDEAIALYQDALAKKPDTRKLHYFLANALIAQGKRSEAIAEYENELRINPGHPLALNDLAWILATDPDPSVRNSTRAVQLAERACRISDYQIAQLVGTLAAAYAEAGRFEEAVATAEKAKLKARAANDPEIARRNAELQALYQLGKPFHSK